jgi:drug/metabolite transporter (DMT)-like permease
MQSLWMLFASVVFAAMGVCVKLASSLYSTSEIVMYRGLVGATVLFCLIRLRGGTLKTTMPGQHLTRGAVGVTSLWMWFYSIAALPLSTAMTLNTMSPIWIAAILFAAGWWHAKNHLEWPLVAAIGASFIGVTLLLQPAFQAQQLAPAVVALVSGMITALAYLQVRKMGLMGEPEYRVVFYFSLMNVAAGVAGNILSAGAGPVVWHAHKSGYGIGLLLAIGLSATMAQIAMTRAYRLGKTLVVANLQYTGIVFSSLFGVLVFGDVFNWHNWAGIGVILLSGVAATFYNTRRTARGTAVAVTDPIASEI